MDGLASVRAEYEILGFDTLPLQAGSKKPIARAWQSRSPHHLWQGAPLNANIGIRGGGLADLAVLDCDEARTFESITRWLAGLGYRGDSYPIVQTASREGRHIYISLSDWLPGDARDLSFEIGAGEFRYGPGAYVVAPPSVISVDSRYTLISGSFSIRPLLGIVDVLPILGNRETTIERRPKLSRKAFGLLQGKNTEIYSSRSEAEQSLLVSLTNAGVSFEKVLELFNYYPCAGKYAELRVRNPKNAERWLLHSYQEAADWTKTHESKARQIAKAAEAWAKSKAWEGRTGAYDRAVYLAHTQIAYRAGRLTYAASCRDLAERAGIGRVAATNANRRLCEAGLLCLETRAIADLANVYQLGQLDKLGHFLSTPIVRKCPTLSAHDAFRFSGFGKSAAEVYGALQDQPTTPKELAVKTGRHIRTIRRALARMEQLIDPFSGEILSMVSCDADGVYHPLPVDLDRIAHAIGTAGTAERQRREHARDRKLHAGSLERGRAQQKDHQETSQNEIGDLKNTDNVSSVEAVDILNLAALFACGSRPASGHTGKV